MKVKITSVSGLRYGVEFSQGVQYFMLNYFGTKTEAMWMAKMLRMAFKSYKEEILNK